MINSQYTPDSFSIPGETLLEILEEKGMSQAELAERMGRPLKTVNEIVKGKTSITPDTSLQLERVIGIPAEFWNIREANFRAQLARQKELEELETHLEWVSTFPIKEMIKRAWIDCDNSKSNQIIALLNFFGVATPKQWSDGWTKHKLAFRKSLSFDTKLGPTSAWLRKGELEAEVEECSQFDRELLISLLPEIKSLSKEKNPDVFLPKLKSLLASAGVVIVFVKPFPGVPIFGASKWLSPHKAMIQLSLRGKTEDLLWFTIFHEIGHILLHSKKELFVEFIKKDAEKPIEEHEADDFAAEQLLPREEFKKWADRQTEFNESNIKRFADSHGISPGIVVGRLQNKDYLDFSDSLNKLKYRFEWSDED